MSKEVKETKKVINDFLHDLEKSQLIKFPNYALFQLFQESQHRAELEVLANSALVRISGIYNTSKQEGKSMLPENEYIAMNKLFHIFSMQASAEELKVYLKAILDPSLINPDVTELGKYLSMIYDKLGYEPQKRQEMNRVLFAELRNALGHLDYDVTLYSFTYRNRTTSITLTNDQFLTMMNEYNTIINTINEYIENNKSKWLK